MHLGEQRAAWETFRKAFHLDPSYHYAGARLFDEQLRTGDLKGAAETLALLELHHPGPRTEAARTRIFSREGRKAEALQLLRELCFVDEAHSDALGVAAKAVANAGWEPEARKIYASALEDVKVNASVGTLWAEILGKRKYWLLSWGVNEIDPRSAAGRDARITLLEKAAETGRRRFVEKMLRRDGEALRESTRAWGAGSYALVTLQQFAEAVRWLSDWESRADAQPWMLFNLAYALHALGRHQDAHAVSSRAVTLHGDGTTARHYLCLAWDDAVRGDYETAARRLGDLPDKDGSPFFTVLRALVNAMVRVAKAAPDERANVYAQERRILRQPQWEALWNDPALRRMAKEGIRKMAGVGGKGPFRVGSIFPARRATGAGGVRLYGVFIAIVLINLIRACATMEPEEKPTPFKPHDGGGEDVNLQEIHDQLERLSAPRN
jgi:tetratricopeptide (TPR) repeat protein